MYYPSENKPVTDMPERVSVDLALHESFFATKSSHLRIVSSVDIVIWHPLFRHPGPNTKRKLNNAVLGAKIIGSYDGQCESFILRKSRRIFSRIPSGKGKDY